MVDRLGWTLVHFVWEGAAVAAGLALALLLARRASAGLRYALALTALALLVTLPFATFALLAPSTPLAFSGTARFTPGTSIVGDSPAETKLPILVGLWAIGVALLSLRLVGAMLHLERWRRRHARPASAEDQARLDALAQRLGVRRRVALFLSDRLEVPSAWGVLRPVVVLPVSLMIGLPPAQVEGILLHELAHVARHDYLVNLLQGFVETALFYHPAVWWISGVVRREREHLCDDVAVSLLGDPMPYARALLHLEERRQAPRPALSATEGDLMNRIARLLAPKPAPVRLSPLAPALAALAVVGLALGGVLRAEAQATRSVPKESVKTKIVAPRVDIDEAQAELRRAEDQLITASIQLQAQRAVQARIGALEALRKKAVLQGDRPRIDAQTRVDKARLRTRLERSQAQVAAARARISQALTRLSAEQAKPSPRPSGATYGAPGKGQHPVWSQGRFPQGVGVLVAPSKNADAAAQDWAAMQRAQADLSRGLTTQREAVLAAEAIANRARVKADFDQARAQESDPQRRAALVAEAQAAQARAEKAVEEGMRNRAALLSQTAATRAQLEAWLKAAQGAKGVGSLTETQKRIVLAQTAAARANAEALKNLAAGAKRGDLAEAKSLFSEAGVFPKGVGSLSPPPLNTAVGLAGAGGLKGLPQLSLLREPQVEVDGDRTVAIDADHIRFDVVIRALAKKTKLRVVIENGFYNEVTVVLDGQRPEKAFEILCKAGHATYHQEEGVYYVSPIAVAPPSGGLGGGRTGD